MNEELFMEILNTEKQSTAVQKAALKRGLEEQRKNSFEDSLAGENMNQGFDGYGS